MGKSGQGKDRDRMLLALAFTMPSCQPPFPPLSPPMPRLPGQDLCSSSPQHALLHCLCACLWLGQPAPHLPLSMHFCCHHKPSPMPPPTSSMLFSGDSGHPTCPSSAHSMREIPTTMPAPPPPPAQGSTCTRLTGRQDSCWDGQDRQLVFTGLARSQTVWQRALAFLTPICL